MYREFMSCIQIVQLVRKQCHKAMLHARCRSKKAESKAPTVILMVWLAPATALPTVPAVLCDQMS